MHISQHPPVITNKDDRDFFQRTIDHIIIKNEVNIYHEEFYYFNVN